MTRDQLCDLIGHLADSINSVYGPVNVLTKHLQDRLETEMRQWTKKPLLKEFTNSEMMELREFRYLGFCTDEEGLQTLRTEGSDGETWKTWRRRFYNGGK